MEHEEERKRGLLGVYDYTVILTYCGFLFAAAGIFNVLGNHFFDAVICMMAAGACDMFDGMVASTKVRTDAEKSFGIQIDSMCDLISSGVLPGLFVYCLLGRNRSAMVVSTLYILCALIRLSYFNVLEAERQKKTTEHRKSYLGMPVTVSAIFVPLVYLVHSNISGFPDVMILVLLAMLGICFLLPIKIRKPDHAGKIVLVIVCLIEMALVFWLR